MKKILQIIPADGWEASFKPVDGEPSGSEMLICFALVEEDGQTHIEGLSHEDGCIDFCEGFSNFDRYVKRGEKG